MWRSSLGCGVTNLGCCVDHWRCGVAHWGCGVANWGVLRSSFRRWHSSLGMWRFLGLASSPVSASACCNKRSPVRISAGHHGYSSLSISNKDKRRGQKVHSQFGVTPIYKICTKTIVSGPWNYVLAPCVLLPCCCWRPYCC
jgi:hypothetical protein